MKRMPENEDERLEALYSLRILDTPPDARFERICLLARSLLDTPIAAISLVDADRVWFKAIHGLVADQVPRALSFCRDSVFSDDLIVVPDTHADERYATNPFVVGEPFIRFYAGAPLALAPGLRVGAACIIDREPHEPTGNELYLLRQLAALTVDELRLHAIERRTRSEQDSTETTGAQVRAGRGLVNWSVRELAAASGVSPMTIKRMEAQDGPLLARDRHIRAVRRSLEEAGVRFIGSPDGQPGVCPRPASHGADRRSDPEGA